MPVLDFKEISKAHIATGEQDSFELFARDFLEYRGYKIISNPDRGADGGKDIVVEERRVGVGGENFVRWLVSCKHKAHSGSSIRPTDEFNIRDRVDANKCDGFIGFYSTLPSAGMSGIIEGISDKIETQVFDKEKIEGLLLCSAKGVELAKRYFPESIKTWQTEHPTPAKEKLLELFQDALTDGEVEIHPVLGIVACPDCKAPISEFREKAFGDDRVTIASITCPHCGWNKSVEV